MTGSKSADRNSRNLLEGFLKLVLQWSSGFAVNDLAAECAKGPLGPSKKKSPRKLSLWMPDLGIADVTSCMRLDFARDRSVSRRASNGRVGRHHCHLHPTPSGPISSHCLEKPCLERIYKAQVLHLSRSEHQHHVKLSFSASIGNHPSAAFLWCLLSI